MDWLFEQFSRFGPWALLAALIYWFYLGRLIHAWPSPKSDFTRVRAELGGAAREIVSVERDGTDFSLSGRTLETWRCYRAKIMNVDGACHTETVGIATMDLFGQPLKRIGKSRLVGPPRR